MSKNLLLLIIPILVFISCSEDEEEVKPIYDHQPNELAGRLEFSNSLKDIWAFDSPSRNREYILVGYYGEQNSDGIHIVDPFDIENPKLIGSVPGVGGFDIKTYGNYAYSVFGSNSYPGFVIDLTDPASPRVVNEFTGAHNIYTTESGLLITNAPGLKIYDIASDPTNPSLLWSDNKEGGHETHVRDNILYDFHGTLGTIIYDITDPANPDSLSTITNSDVVYHHSGWTNADQTVLILCDELSFRSDPSGADFYVYDISDKTNPVFLTSVSNESSILHNVHIVGDYAYFAHYTAGYKVYDISNPENPAIEFEYDTAPNQTGENFNGAWGVYGISESGYKYISDISNGLFIFKGAE
ncbi:LVIVD repeat-containing protein [Mangrovivirga cuniculi]|uniref:Choice-of-anchor B family protein n=1 Tax=Mangrovivirga cuniculi TaxID=2715131 RepID=A0A4D7K0Z9_9BACT|nr:choice-of-anchor B family protein [Mangrovivirga cuniculi]QCK16595.1 hypothetical protein DCC35_18605 [Mangrovivirga cuniculi]